MKTIISIIVFLFTFLSVFAQQRGFKEVNININGSTTKLYSQSHALVIGISNYTNDWPDLPGVNNDVDAVKAALEQHDFNVITVEDATKEQIDKSISDFISKYGQDADNRIIIYFAGHGHTIKTNYGEELGYIVPVDAPNPNIDAPTFQAKAIEMADFEKYAKRIQSKHVLFLFDACFSGSLFALSRAAPEIISYKTSQPVRQFITSGSAQETVPDVSIFRKQFVSAITTNEADANKDGYLTGTELGDYLQTNVVNYSYNMQHPQFGKIRNANLDKGDFVFVLKKKTVPVNNDESDMIIVTEENLATYGSVEIVSTLNGSLYLDGKFIKQVYPDTKITLSNIKSGTHKMEIKTDGYNWSKDINIMPQKTTSVNTGLTTDENKNITSDEKSEISSSEGKNTKYSKNQIADKVKAIGLGLIKLCSDDPQKADAVMVDCIFENGKYVIPLEMSWYGFWTSDYYKIDAVITCDEDLCNAIIYYLNYESSLETFRDYCIPPQISDFTYKDKSYKLRSKKLGCL